MQCYRGAIIRLEAAWRHCLACASEAACRPAVECYRRQRAKQFSPPRTLCVGGQVIIMHIQYHQMVLWWWWCWVIVIMIMFIPQRLRSCVLRAIDYL